MDLPTIFSQFTAISNGNNWVLTYDLSWILLEKICAHFDEDLDLIWSWCLSMATTLEFEVSNSTLFHKTSIIETVGVRKVDDDAQLLKMY